MDSLPSDMIKQIMKYMEPATVQYVVCLLNRKFHHVLWDSTGNKPSAAIALGKYIPNLGRAADFGIDASHAYYLACYGSPELIAETGVVDKKILIHAIRYNNIPVFNYLLPLCEKNVYYLRTAVENGRYEICEILLERCKRFDNELINYVLLSTLECCELVVKYYKSSHMYEMKLNNITNDILKYANIPCVKHIINSIGADHHELIYLSAVDEDCYNFMIENGATVIPGARNRLYHITLMRHNFTTAKKILSTLTIPSYSISKALISLIKDDNHIAVEYLLDEGAKFGKYVLPKCKSVSMLEILLKRSPVKHTDNFVSFARKGRIDLIKKMHKYGHRGDYRAVLAAARGGHYDCMRYLVREGYGIPAEASGVKDKKCRRFLESLFQ